MFQISIEVTVKQLPELFKTTIKHHLIKKLGHYQEPPPKKKLNNTHSLTESSKYNCNNRKRTLASFVISR